MGYWPVQFSSDKVFVQSIFQISTWKVFLLKIYLLWKIWPISVKRWKPVWVRAYDLFASVRKAVWPRTNGDRRSHVEKQVVVSTFSAGHKKVQQSLLNQTLDPPPPAKSNFPGSATDVSLSVHTFNPETLRASPFCLKIRIPAFKYKVNTGLQKPIGKPLFWWVRRLTWLKWGLKSVLVYWTYPIRN